MDQVQSTYAPTDPAYAENMRWAEEALVTAVFCIIICGAWGTLSIRYLAPFLLQKVRGHHIQDFRSTGLCRRGRQTAHGRSPHLMKLLNTPWTMTESLSLLHIPVACTLAFAMHAVSGGC